MAFVEQENAVARQFGEMHRLSEIRALRCRQDEGIGEQGGLRQAGIFGRLGGDHGDVDLAGPQSGQQEICAGFGHVENDIRHDPPERRIDVGQQIGRDCRNETEAQGPRRPSAGTLRKGGQGIGGGDDMCGARQELPAERRRVDGPRRPLEQPDAEPLLDLADLLTQRRLGDAADRGSATEMTGFGKSEGKAQLVGA